MTKLTTSAIGLLLLNPIGCSGVDTLNNDTLDSGLGGTGGSGNIVRCSVMTGGGCPANQICKQTMFPIMPPQGYAGKMGSDLLGECVAAGQGGSSSTGGVQSVGGNSNTTTAGATSKGGEKSAGGHIASSEPEHSLIDQDSWWHAAEAALRRS